MRCSLFFQLLLEIGEHLEELIFSEILHFMLIHPYLGHDWEFSVGFFDVNAWEGRRVDGLRVPDVHQFFFRSCCSSSHEGAFLEGAIFDADEVFEEGWRGRDLKREYSDLNERTKMLGVNSSRKFFYTQIVNENVNQTYT